MTIVEFIKLELHGYDLHGTIILTKFKILL